MSERPLIAIAPASKPADYVASIERAGGEPWLLDRERDAPADVLARAAAVLLMGGEDVDPALYGEAPHPTTVSSESGRDAYEIALVRGAVEADVPLLAICRGLQVVNVALGGTLVQDIPSQVPDALAHAVKEPRDRPAHAVTIVPGSTLDRLLPDASARDVNSRHHQSVKRPADGLVVSATAPDGVIEALERPASTFLVGVQWHPENFVSEPPPHEGGRFLALFRALVTAASARAKRALA